MNIDPLPKEEFFKGAYCVSSIKKITKNWLGFMSDIFDDICGITPGSGLCKVAYTLNNTQPVICTIIGAQPLFYMDHDPEDIDGDFDSIDAAEMQILASELETLRKEIAMFDRFSVNFENNEINTVELFLENKETLCRKETIQTAPIKDLIAILNRSRLMKSYLDFAGEHGVTLEYSAQTETSCYDRKNGKIQINPYLPREDQLLLSARELRRHFQHRHGALIHPLLFNPDHAVLVNRVQMADLCMAMIRAAWELQLCGEKTVWERIEFSSLADLGHAFAREAFTDFRTLNNGEAGTAVFEAWFLSERCRHADKELIKSMLADHNGYTFEISNNNHNTSVAEIIAALGAMPYGKNYLGNHVMTIMDDPIFTDVRDRSNANFLWFIKFERSFRETEQYLQTDLDHTAEGVRPEASHFKDQDQNDANQRNPAELIQLFPQHAQSQHKTGDKSSKDGILLQPGSSDKRSQYSAQIIDLRHPSV